MASGTGFHDQPRLGTANGPGEMARSSRVQAVAWSAYREASGFLVGPAVFKTDEAASGRLAGSIPVRLRSLALFEGDLC
jgi:hypothetical protein